MNASPREEAAALGPQLRLWVRRLPSLSEYGIVLAFLTLFVTLSVSSSAFLTKTNLLNILDQWSAVGIIALGWTFVVIAGGFDLSVAAVYAVAGVIAAMAANELGPALGLLFGCLVGLGFGAVNGIAVTLGRINPFMATLASGIVIRGVATAVTGGLLISVTNPDFEVLGGASFLDAKYSVYLFAGVILVTGIVLHRTTFGRYVYASGGNAEAARLSGVRVNLIRASTYMICGLCAGIGGTIVTSRVAQGQADSGIGLEFDVIAAVVIGGTSILGGDGAIWRTVLGVLLIAMIRNGFNLLSIDPVYQQMFFGGIIAAAVAVDAWTKAIKR